MVIHDARDLRHRFVLWGIKPCESPGRVPNKINLMQDEKSVVGGCDKVRGVWPDKSGKTFHR